MEEVIWNEILVILQNAYLSPENFRAETYNGTG